MNEYLNITKDNIDSEHLCCAIGDPKHQEGVKSKKEWLKKQLDEGHVFRKLKAQGKIFIEYAPIEKAWAPVNGDEYIYIYCLWVAGSFKGKGYAKELLTYAIEDAKENHKKGLCVISSKKKKPFLAEKGFFEHYGFKVVDTIKDYELLALSFDGSIPHFTNSAKEMKIQSNIFTIYYSNECPYTVHSIKELEEYTKKENIEANFIAVDTLEKAKQVPCIFNNWANFKNGEFVSNTILNTNSFIKLIS